MDTKPVFHGSDIEKICSYYNLKKENIVKFGANVNPLGLSPKAGRAIAEHVDILSSYPDREYTSLRNTISSYCNIPADFILPGNGSSELISLLIQERAPKHTLILGPTYSEYSRELSFSGSTQEYYHLQESNDFEPDIPDLCRKLEQGYDFLILCNPNNPTSSAITQEELRRLIGFCAEKNIFVMIDETYVEFAPDINAITAVPLTRNSPISWYSAAYPNSSLLPECAWATASPEIWTFLQKCAKNRHHGHLTALVPLQERSCCRMKIILKKPEI